MVDGDAQRLERMVFNLLQNAIRATNPGGQIWLTVNEKDGVAVLKVRDTGVGLSAEALARVFQTGDLLNRNNPGEAGQNEHQHVRGPPHRGVARRHDHRL